MTDTPRLTLPEISASQSNKSVTHNDALQRLDILVQSSVIDKDLTAPPGSPANGDLYIVAATGTGAWATHDKALAYYRSGWVFYPASGSPGAANEGLTAWVKDENKAYTFDGTNWVSSAAAGLILDDLADVVLTSLAQGDMLRRNGSSQWVNEKPIYDIGINRTTGTPTASQVTLDFEFNRTVVFPSGLTGSVGVATTAATAQTDFDIRKNGSSVGTMRFAAAGTTASFIMASATTFNSSDRLQVVAPATPDATLASIGFTLAGTRS